MAHIDDETLALLALGERADDPRIEAHLLDCAACRDELASLSETARIGRETVTVDRLAHPEPRVWDAISAELGFTSGSVTTLESDAARSIAPFVPVPVAAGGPDSRRHRRERPRRWRRSTVLLAAAASVAVVAGSGAVAWQLLSPDRATVMADARLDAFPDWDGATGTATLERTAEGRRVLEVSVDAESRPGGYRELWLIDGETSELISLGILNGDSGEFSIPDDVDLARYSVVDVSEEPADGDPAHSGDSIVRGPLQDRA